MAHLRYIKNIRCRDIEHRKRMGTDTEVNKKILEIRLEYNMAESASVAVVENPIPEIESEAMHVDVTPSTSDREDEGLNNVAVEKPEANLNLFNVISPEKLQQRALRFGSEAPTQKTVTEAELKVLYKSFEVDWRDSGSKSHKLRRNAVHMRGVEEMSTQDIFDYYKDQPPDSIEWINDFSCNAVWLDPISAARALLSFSRPIRRSSLSGCRKQASNEEMREEVAIISEPEDGEDVEMAEQESSCPSVGNDSQRTHSRRHSGDPMRTPVPNNSPVDSSQIEDSSLSDSGVEIDSSKIDIPIPPGPWRLGATCSKAKALLLRLAYRSDRKIPGAEKMSKYYLTHGNPNYKGIKGIISNSMKRKIKDYRRAEYVDLDAVQDDDLAPLIDPDYSLQLKDHYKRPRMRMYADDEEERMKRFSAPLQPLGSSSFAGDLRHRINSDGSDSRDLRSKLNSGVSKSTQPKHSPNGGESRASNASSGHRRKDLSQPIVVGDLRSKLEQLRQARQPKVPLVIEISHDLS